MPADRTLVLGGARSGKSRYAESLLASCAGVRYVATGYPAADDADWLERVRMHRERRPATWNGIESLDLIGLLIEPRPTPLLIDCLGLWLTRVIDAADGWVTPSLPPKVVDDIDRLAHAWADYDGTAVAVTNEVGLGVVPPTPSGRRFCDALGTLNQQLATASEHVWLVVAGVPVQLK